MNPLFDSIIINLKTQTRMYFNNQLEKYINTKKKCNQFAKYIKSKNISDKIVQICYCKRIHKLNLEQRSLKKLKKFFKDTNNLIIYNFLDHLINYNELISSAFNIFKLLKPILKQYIYRNNLKSQFTEFDLFTTFNLLNKIILILKAFFDNTLSRNSSPFINKLNNISTKSEKYIYNIELNNRFQKIISTFSMRIIYLVSHDYENIHDIYNLSFTEKKIFYIGFISKLINIMSEYIKIVNIIETVTVNINTTLEIEILTLSSETDSIDDPHKNNLFTDSYEDSMIFK